MWEIYDELIELIPKNLIINEFLAGSNWFLVDSGSIGMAMTPKEGRASISISGHVAGMKVYEVAKLIKSWNNYEAALGLAAINSVINIPGKIAKFNGEPINNQVEVDTFECMQDQIKGKKVAVIGHFINIERLYNICDLSVIERIPMGNDLPDPSCEYILPEQDFVFITGSTLINKTLPRLLQLSRNAFVTLLGPSTPMAPCLFKYGIDMLAGTVVYEREKVWSLIRESGGNDFFNNGALMVKISK